MEISRAQHVPDIASQQGGVFTAEQARSEGWTARAVRRRIETRRWVYVAGQALAEPRATWTAFQLAMAADLSMPDVVISHRTAAGPHRFPLEAADDEVPGCEVIVRRHQRAGLRIHAHLVRLDSTDVMSGPADLWVTTPERTALDCLASMPFGPALDLWAWIATRRVLDPKGLDLAIARRRGWSGTRQLRKLSVLVASGGVSQAEFVLQDLLRSAKIDGWTANAQVSDDRGPIGVVDLLFEEAQVIVEVDGWRAHNSRSRFITDRRRQNRLVAAGYTVLRFTWDDLQTRPTHVIQELQAAIGRTR